MADGWVGLLCVEGALAYFVNMEILRNKPPLKKKMISLIDKVQI